MANLLILTDGGGDIGFGHVVRCIAIKNAWSSGSARLLVQMEGDALAFNDTEPFDWLNSSEKLRDYAAENLVLLVDSYRPDEDYFRLLRKIFSFIVVFDDYNRISYPVDLVICPAVYGNLIDYSNQIAKTVGGAEYVILRPDILAARKLETRQSIESVLVTFGGSPLNETLYQQVIDILEGNGYQAKVVAGNDLLAKKLRTNNSQIFGRLDTLMMAELMTSVDVAISGAGQTLNELAWLGIPAFSVKTGEDQHGNWDFYKRNNLSVASVLPNDHNFEYTIVNTLKNQTFFTRLEMANKLRELLTPTGAKLICSLIENMGCIEHE